MGTQPQLYAREQANAAMRRALDKAFREVGSIFTMDDENGHVFLVDGDFDPNDLADEIMQGMINEGWTFRRMDPADVEYLRRINDDT